MAFTYWYTGIPEGGRYTKKVSVQADTTEEAISAVRRIHGIKDPAFAGTSRGDDDESGFGGMDLGSSLTWCLILGGGLLFLYALPFIIAFGAIGLVCWGGYKLLKWIANQS